MEGITKVLLALIRWTGSLIALGLIMMFVLIMGLIFF